MESRKDTHCEDDVADLPDLDDIVEHEHVLRQNMEEERPGRGLRPEEAGIDERGRFWAGTAFLVDRSTNVNCIEFRELTHIHNSLRLCFLSAPQTSPWKEVHA